MKRSVKEKNRKTVELLKWSVNYLIGLY